MTFFKISKTLSVVWEVLREIFITSVDRLNASQYPVSKHCPTVSAMAPAMVSLATLINLVRALTTSRVAGKLLQVQFSETRKHCQFRTIKHHIARDIRNIILFSIADIWSMHICLGIFAHYALSSRLKNSQKWVLVSGVCVPCIHFNFEALPPRGLQIHKAWCSVRIYTFIHTYILGSTKYLQNIQILSPGSRL